MKNYVYLAALCCVLSSCNYFNKKTNEIVTDKTKGVFTKNTYYLPWDAIKSKPDGELVNQIPDWFEEEYPAYEVTNWFTVSAALEASGVYISYVKKEQPDDADIFIMDESGSLVAKLSRIKAIEKPTSGGGIFHNTDDVWVRYHLENGWFVPEVLEVSPDTNTHKKETVRSYEELKISSPQKKSGATASQKNDNYSIKTATSIITPWTDTVDGLVTTWGINQQTGTLEILWVHEEEVTK